MVFLRIIKFSNTKMKKTSFIKIETFLFMGMLSCIALSGYFIYNNHDSKNKVSRELTSIQSLLTNVQKENVIESFKDINENYLIENNWVTKSKFLRQINAPSQNELHLIYSKLNDTDCTDLVNKSEGLWKSESDVYINNKKLHGFKGSLISLCAYSKNDVLIKFTGLKSENQKIAEVKKAEIESNRRAEKIKLEKERKEAKAIQKAIEETPLPRTTIVPINSIPEEKKNEASKNKDVHKINIEEDFVDKDLFKEVTKEELQNSVVEIDVPISVFIKNDLESSENIVDEIRN